MNNELDESDQDGGVLVVSVFGGLKEARSLVAERKIERILLKDCEPMLSMISVYLPWQRMRYSSHVR
jgi:hypothetical protein